MGAVVVWIIECDGCLANYEGKQLVYFDTREEALSSVRPTQSDRWVRHGDTTYCGRCAREYGVQCDGCWGWCPPGEAVGVRVCPECRATGRVQRRSLG